AANAALLHLLRFDLAGLEKDFALYGRRDSEAWELALDPRTDTLRRSVGRITASGVGATIRRIEIKRTEKQIIEIIIAPPRPAAAFTAAELQTFFR
ncbi:MAG: LolA-related protein, partial [Opitutus sp.]